MAVEEIGTFSHSESALPWSEAPVGDIPYLEEYVFRNIQTFPLKASVVCLSLKGRLKDFLLDLVPGDLVTFKLLPDSDLREREILLLNRSGESDRHYRINLNDLSDNQLGLFYCVLPYLKAYVEDVFVQQGSYGLRLVIDIRFDFAALDIAGLVERIWRVTKDPWVEWFDIDNTTISSEDK